MLELGVKTLLCLPARLADRQPHRRPAARRRGHPQAGQRQSRRHQRAAHAGSGVRDLGDPHRRRQGLAGRGCRAGPAAVRPGSCDRSALAGGRLRARRSSSATSIPVWYGFRGGKGAATLVGVLLGLKPVALVPVLVVWLLVVMISGFVGLATMVATAAFPAYVAAAGIDPSLALDQLRLRDAAVRLLHASLEHRENARRNREPGAAAVAAAQALAAMIAAAKNRNASRRRRRAARGCSRCWRPANSIPASSWPSACGFRAAASGS